MDTPTVTAQVPAATPVPVVMPDGGLLYVRAEPVGAAALPGAPDDEQEIAGRVPSLDQVARAVGTFTGQIGAALRQAAPTRFSLTFECEIGFEAGGLVALIGKGSGRSAFSVTMEWDRTAEQQPGPPTQRTGETTAPPSEAVEGGA